MFDEPGFSAFLQVEKQSLFLTVILILILFFANDGESP